MELKKNIWRGQTIHRVGLRSDMGMRGMMPHRAHVAGDAAETTMERLHQIQTAACTSAVSMRQQDNGKIMNACSAPGRYPTARPSSAEQRTLDIDQGAKDGSSDTHYICQCAPSQGDAKLSVCIYRRASCVEASFCGRDEPASGADRPIH